MDHVRTAPRSDLNLPEDRQSICTLDSAVANGPAPFSIPSTQPNGAQIARVFLGCPRLGASNLNLWTVGEPSACSAEPPSLRLL